ncbi:ribonucleoside-diphosphate reductase large subunit [Moorella phage MTATph1]
MNAGTENPMLSACFVLDIPDDMYGIFTAVRDMVMVQKYGGGTGFDFSALRPSGDMVSGTGGVASGPISFLKAFDAATEAVKQGGKRRGACMGVLRVDHPDILQFIKAKEKDGEISNFNLSVGVTDSFMEAAIAGRNYDLINPRTGEKAGELNAREVLELIAYHAWLNGEPGILYLDTINRANPTPALGQIRATNPCLPYDTLVGTSDGFYQIGYVGDRIKEKGVWLDPRRRQESGIHEPFSQAKFFCTGTKEVYKLTTKNGMSIKATADHKFLTPDGWKELRELKPGDEVCVMAALDDAPFGDVGNEDLDRIASMAYSICATHNRAQVPRELLRYSREGQLAFIRACYASNGMVVEDDGKCGIVLKDLNRAFYRDLQVVLLNFGVLSYYPLDTFRHENVLVVPLKFMKRFLDAIGFILPHWEDKARELIKKYNIGDPQPEDYVVKVHSVKSVGRELVYDISEPLTHSFIANGFVVHNCGEVPLLPGESCNLGSINLENHQNNGDWDWDKLETTTKLAVRILDNIIDLNWYPLPFIAERSRITRKIGLGVMGFHAALIRMGIPYNSDRAVQEAKRVMNFIHAAAREASIALAKERGVFPAWPQSIWQPIPIRNAQLTVIAPTGSISRLAQTSSGMEPLFALSYTSKILGGTYKECLPVVRETLSPGDLEIALKTGRINNEVYKTAQEIPYQRHIEMQAAFQNNGVDGSVSKTINMPNSATREDVLNAIIQAYESGCKGLTIFRDGSRQEQVLSTHICPECGTPLINQDGCWHCPSCSYGRCSIA